jgi:hypothetical protein
MKRLIICIHCVVLLSLSCVSEQPAEYSKHSSEQSDTGDRSQIITVFFTGYELGALKPCGCSGGQLGGLDRRSAVFNTVPEVQRLIIDTGSLVSSESEQDLIKFNIIIQAFDLLGYDLIHFNQHDLEIISNNFGSLDGYKSILNIIAPSGPSDLDAQATFTQRFQLHEKIIDVTVATIDVNSTPVEFIEGLYPSASEAESELPGYRVNILILNRCEPQLIRSIAENSPFVDCLICPSDSDEPHIVSDPNNSPLAFSVGRKGRHITKLEIDTSQINDRPKLTFKTQSVTEDLKQNQALINLYKDYQQIVKDRNLLEDYPRFTLPDGLRYAGSESCNVCHQYAYIEWMTKPHASAFATLEEVGSQYDPECVKCHVVGMDYESGFVSESKTPLMKDVGCEVCHGPGSKHNAYPHEINMPVSEPNSVCIDCHTPEHSDDYAGHEEEKLLLIKHWPEPNDLSDVK